MEETVRFGGTLDHITSELGVRVRVRRGHRHTPHGRFCFTRRLFNSNNLCDMSGLGGDTHSSD